MSFLPFITWCIFRSKTHKPSRYAMVRSPTPSLNSCMKYHVTQTPWSVIIRWPRIFRSLYTKSFVAGASRQCPIASRGGTCSAGMSRLELRLTVPAMNLSESSKNHLSNLRPLVWNRCLYPREYSWCRTIRWWTPMPCYWWVTVNGQFRHHLGFEFSMAVRI